MTSRLLSLAACVLAFTGCKEPPRKAIVIGRFGWDQMSEANLHHGVKTYQLPNGHGYSEALIYEVENGKIKELATHPLKKSESFDTLLTFSVLPANGSPNWMTWCDQSGTGQIPFLQEKLPEDWQLSNASRERIMTLEDDKVLIDTIVFRKKDAPVVKAADDPLQSLFSDNLESLAKTTERAEDYKVVTLIIRR